MQATTFIKILFITLIFGLARSASAAIVIDSTRSTPSRCATDGTITIYGQSPSSMLYAIISGPDIRPAQSGSQFGGLPHGSYSVMVTNFSNDTTLAAVVVGGSYTFPDFSPTYADPFCAGTATGMILGNALLQGTAPFIWTLTPQSGGAAITQASDTFSNLPAGMYSLRQTDSCQSFATRSITLTDPVHDFTISNIGNEVWACDTVQVYLQLYLPGGNYAAPYTIRIQTQAGTYQHVINNLSYGGWYPDFRERVGGVSYGDFINITITDACGFSQAIRDVVAPFNVDVSFQGKTDTCTALFAAYAYITGYNNQLDVRPTTIHGPVTVILSDPVTGVVIDSSVTDVDTIQRSIFAVYSPYLASGHTYRLTLRDGCGQTYTNIYQWPVIAAPYTNEINMPLGCFDSVASHSFYWYNTFYTEPIFTLLSGPATVHSTKAHYAYSDTIIYPQVYRGLLANTTAQGSFVHGLSLGNLGVGTYTYTVRDSCGHTQTGSFTILPQDVSDLRYSLSYSRGCPGQNTANIGVNNLNYLSYGILSNDQGSFNHYIQSTIDTVRNLDAGRYILTLQYYNMSIAPVNQNPGCYIFRDTIVIPPYQVPQIDYAIQIKCHGLVNVGLQPDSSRGIAPYSYEILSGPQTAPVQTSNFFALTQPGTYTARISDVCGFARTFTFFVDTLSFAQVVKVGSSCVGSSAILFNQHSPYATYQWQRPGGSRYTGDTLFLSPVQPGDYGVYHIMKIVNVNSCRDTFYATYTLTGNTVVNFAAAICSGDSVIFGGQVYFTAGTYADTVTTAGCDSISILQLSVRSGIYDSISRTICSGQSVTVGTHVYTTTGIYRDTIAATGCDTIHVLNLLVTTIRRDSVVTNICEGQSVTVGTHIYTATGIYRDTFSTSSCDSLHILDLRVGAYMRDTFVRSVCTGQSVTIGTHVYTTTGVYRDTLPTGTCGLIILLDLRVGVSRRDSVSRTICAGQSITVGTHIYSTTGIYRDTFATAGCDSIYILNLQVGSYRRDSVSLSICTGQSVTVGTHIYTTSGIYRDTFATAGCDSIYILNLQVGSYRRDSVSLSICTGQSVTVGTHIYTTSGTYRDTFATAGCDSIHILTLLVGNAKLVSASQGICAGQSVTVGSHVYNSSGVYRDTLTSSGGCDSIYVLTLSVGTVSRDTLDIAFCEGSSLSVGGITYTQSGIFSDTFATSGCDSIRSIRVAVWPRPAITVSVSATEVSEGDTVQLSAAGSPSLTYHWTSEAILSDDDAQNPTAIIGQATWAVVQATDAHNCTATDSIFIKLGDCKGSLFVPNAFTPNGDGKNDVYHVFGRCVKLHWMKIFNRWGEKVWETEDMDIGWDGTYRGAMQPTEVYVYVLSYSTDSPSAGTSTARQMQGSITLIR